MTSRILYIAAFFPLLLSCIQTVRPDADNGNSTPEVSSERTFYAKGADISWSTRMESEGIRFYDKEGNEKECTALMKDLGMNSIRLRVWVDPKDGWCGKEDVLVKAEKAHALGMKLMVDFHYSDTWADPGHQVTPSAWSSYDLAGLTNAVYDHTKEILEALKGNGIDVEWVQIGNEVNTGMLHPLGKVQDDNASNFVKLLNSGYKAVKDVFSDAKVILHISNGQEQELFTWFLNLMRTNGGMYDMVGMSLYPSWWENGGWKDWKPAVASCMSNIKSIVKTYGKPVMLCEVGLPVEEPELSRDAVREIIERTKEIKECHGVFYWEPQAEKGYNGGYDKGAFADGRPTVALDPFRN